MHLLKLILLFSLCIWMSANAKPIYLKVDIISSSFGVPERASAIVLEVNNVIATNTIEKICCTE
jgi:hypothetical protein